MRLGTKKIVTTEILNTPDQPEQKPTAVQPVLFEVAPKVPETDDEILNYKVDDRAFWRCMRKTLGNCAKAARLIKAEFDIDITRQAVHARANRNPDLLAECKEIMIDTAEEIMMNLLLGSDKKVAADMVKHITKTLGKQRGYVEKTESTNEHIVKSVSVEYTINEHRFATDESEIDDDDSDE